MHALLFQILKNFSQLELYHMYQVPCSDSTEQCHFRPQWLSSSRQEWHQFTVQAELTGVFSTALLRLIEIYGGRMKKELGCVMCMYQLPMMNVNIVYSKYALIKEI